MAKRGFRKLTSSKPKRLRPLSFDKLEDRRLLAGLNISIFEDVNASGAFENDVDAPVALWVAYLDANHNGALDSGEKFAISDSDGLARFADLASGEYWLSLLGDANPAVPVVIGEQDVSVAVPVVVDPSKTAPAWTQDSLHLEGTEDTALPFNAQVLLPLVNNEAADPTFFFVSAEPTHGKLEWSVSHGGVYTPDPDFFGTDSFLVKIYDGQSWSNDLQVDINVAPVDDLPTALHVTFVASVSENEPNALLGTYTVDDVDGGPQTFGYGNPSLYEAANGEIRLRAGQFLNFEQSSSLAVSLVLAGQAGSGSALAAGTLLPVTDENDLSTGIQLYGIPEVVEFRRGANFGQLRVIDEDAHDSYTWVLSDDRFYVDENSNLRLLADAFLETRESTDVRLVLTATSSMGGDSIDSEINIRVDQAPPSYQNPVFPMDVNNDGTVSSLDVLAIINRFNGRGSRDLSGPPPSGPYDYVDVNGDRTLSSLDVLVVVNYINSMRRNTGSGEGGNRGGGGNRLTVPTPLNQQPANSTQANDIAQQVAAAQSTEYQQKLRRSL